MASFEKAYTGRPELFGRKPTWRLREFLESFDSSGGTALDLGCGHGRDALFLASRGLRVDACDCSEAAITALDSAAKEAGVSLSSHVVDVRDLDFPGESYDIIVARTLLDHLDRDDGRVLVDKIKEWCRPGGGVFVTVFTVDDAGYRDPAGSDASEFASAILHYFERNELLHAFEDFYVKAYEEVTKVDESHGLPHIHGKARIVALKDAQ